MMNALRLSLLRRSGRPDCCRSFSRQAADGLFDFNWRDFLQYRKERHALEPEAVSSLLRTLAAEGESDRILDVMAYQGEWKQRVGLEAYSRLIESMTRMGDHTAIARVFTDMRKDGLKPDIGIYNQMLSFLGRRKNVKLLEVWTDKIEKEGLQFDYETYVVLISAYLRRDDPERALQYYEQLKKTGHKMDARPYEELLHHFATEKNTEMVNTLVAEMETKQIRNTVNVMNALLLAHCRLGDMKEAARLLKKMEKKDSLLPPNEATYLTMLRGYSASGKVVEAEAIFEQIDEPSANAMRTLLRTYAHFGEKTKAEHLATRILKIDAPSPVKYLSIVNVVDTCVRAENVDAAHRWMSMLDNIIPPSASFLRKSKEMCFNLLIRVHAQNREVSQALEMVRLAGEQKVRLSSTAKSNVILALGKAGDFAGAEATFNEMTQSGTKMTRAMVDALICVLAHAGEIEKALKLRSETKDWYQPNRMARHAMARAFAQAGNLEAMRSEMDAIQSEFSFNILSYDIMLDAYSRQEDPVMYENASMDILHTLQKAEMVPTTNTIDKLLSINMNTEPHIVEVIKYLKQHHENFFGRQLRLWEEQLSRDGHNDIALELKEISARKDSEDGEVRLFPSEHLGDDEWASQADGASQGELPHAEVNKEEEIVRKKGKRTTEAETKTEAQKTTKAKKATRKDLSRQTTLAWELASAIREGEPGWEEDNSVGKVSKRASKPQMKLPASAK